MTNLKFVPSRATACDQDFSCPFLLQSAFKDTGVDAAIEFKGDWIVRMKDGDVLLIVIVDLEVLDSTG